MWMNAPEIDEAADMHKNHPVLGPATQFLQQFKDTVNANSDGWAYWKVAGTSAAKLMEIIQAANLRNGSSAVIPTAAQVQKAMIPIKATCTKHKLPQPKVLGAGEYLRDDVNKMLAARINALDDAEVAKVFSSLFGKALRVKEAGVLTTEINP